MLCACPWSISSLGLSISSWMWSFCFSQSLPLPFLLPSISSQPSQILTVWQQESSEKSKQCCSSLLPCILLICSSWRQYACTVCVCVCVLLPYSDSECHSRGTDHSIQQPVLHRLRRELIFFSFAETKPPARPTASYQRWFETLWETVYFFIHILWFVITLICQGYVNQCTMHCMLNLGQNCRHHTLIKGCCIKR